MLLHANVKNDHVFDGFVENTYAFEVETADERAVAGCAIDLLLSALGNIGHDL